MKSVFKKLSLLAFVCLSVFSFKTTNFAQDLDDVIIRGRISDPNGQAIVGATVTAILVETGVERTVTTNEDGLYRIIELKPGLYKITASANGFGTKEKVDLQTISGQNVQLDFGLAPADVQAQTTVTVTDEDAPAVDTTRTVVGGTVTQREIEELPNLNRTPLDFVFTLGGVTEEPLSVRDAAEDRAFGTSTTGDPRPAPLESGIFSLSGGAAYSNNITIDGLDNNDDRLAQERFQPSIDSIAEVQVITNQFSAEYGRASGGRVNIRTRGGTKKFRGRAFMYYRDSDFNANTYNNNRRGLERLPFQDYNPGFTFGGPIPFGYFKDKTFFFSAYEYDKFLDTTLIDTIVPVGQNPNFALPASTGGTQRQESNRNIPASAGFTPALVSSFVQTLPTPSTSHIFLQRIDHNFTGKHNITFNFEYGDSRNQRQFRNALNRLEEAVIAPSRNTDAYKFTDNLVLSSNLVNQFRFQFSRFSPKVAAANPLDPVVLISLNDNTTLPASEQRNGTLIAGNSTATTNFNFPGTRREKRLQFQDTFSAVLGKHSLKLGGDVQRIDSEFADTRDATGTFNFVSVRAFLDNRISQFRRNFGQSSKTENVYYGFFVQDEWRAKSNVTLSFGLRYEAETIVDDKNNFGPRAAIAYAPFKDGKGVIRVGGGIFFNRVLLRTFDDSNLTETRVSYDSGVLPGPSNFNTDECYVLNAVTASNYNMAKCVFLRQVQFPNVLTLADLQRIEATLPVGANGVRPTGFTSIGDLRRIDPNLQIPESYQFNVGFEREIFKSIVFEANYTYNKTVHLFREININAYRLPSNFKDYNDYLIRGNTNPNFVFFNGSPTDPAVATSGGITRVNLNTSSTSTAAGSAVAVARAQLSAQLGRGVNNNINDINQVVSVGNSLYNGLTLEFRKRYRKFGYGFGGSFRAVYTLSKLLDDGLNNTTNAQTEGDFSSEYSIGRQDRRHRFAFSGTFDLPKWLLGLKMSPILRLSSSSPFDLGNGGIDRNLSDNSNDRPNFTGNIDDIRFREPGEPIPTGLISQFSLAPIGSSGNLPRNAGKGPGQFIFDFNVSREIRFTERFRLRPNAEFGNILNARVFTFGSEFIDLSAGSNNTEFLIPTRTLRPRQIRLGIRFDF